MKDLHKSGQRHFHNEIVIEKALDIGLMVLVPIKILKRFSSNSN